MPIIKAFAYLIAPSKGFQNAPAISNKEITVEQNKLSTMLASIFSDEPGLHDFEITFNPAPDGTQVNECRSLMLAFQANPTVNTGLHIAQRLQGFTDNRSGTGLFFLLSGNHGLKKGW